MSGVWNFPGARVTVRQQRMAGGYRFFFALPVMVFGGWWQVGRFAMDVTDYCSRWKFVFDEEWGLIAADRVCLCLAVLPPCEFNELIYN